MIHVPDPKPLPEKKVIDRDAQASTIMNMTMEQYEKYRHVLLPAATKGLRETYAKTGNFHGLQMTLPGVDWTKY